MDWSGCVAKDLNYSALLDYYGAMLTEKQREAMLLYYNEDLSLSEISEIVGTSRQGVMDILRRSEVQLNQLESHLMLSKVYNKLSSAILDLESIIQKTNDEELKSSLLNVLNKLQ